MENLNYITGNYGKYVSVKEKFENAGITIYYFKCDLDEPDVNDIEFISKEKLTDTKLILSFFGTEKEKAIENFVKFHSQEEKEANYAEYEIINRLTDERAKQIVETVLRIDNVTKLKNYNSSIIKRELNKLKEVKGTTISQLSRITGINRKIIERAMK